MKPIVKRIPWPGHGYIRKVGGRQTYVINRKIGGVKFERSTGRADLKAAMAEYVRFEQDPHGYAPLPPKVDAPDGPHPVYLDGVLIENFLTYSVKHCRNSKEWFFKKRYYLTWWAEELRDVDLRTIDLKRHVYPALKQKSAQAHRIAVLKHFFSFLHDARDGAGVLEANEARCIDLDLHVDAKDRKPRQQTQPRWFPYENYQLARPHLLPWMQDACDVLAATGWHYSELRLFVRKENAAGAIEDPPGATAYPGTGFTVDGGKQKTPEKTQVLVTRHKGGQIHKTRVSLALADIARRLQERGNIDPNRLHNRLAEICETHEIKPAVTPGAFRHSVATWLYNSGVALAAISTFLGHASPITTKRFYAALGVAQNPMLSLVG